MDTEIINDETFRAVTIKRVDDGDLLVEDAIRLAKEQVGHDELYENGGAWLVCDTKLNNYDKLTVFFTRER